MDDKEITDYLVHKYIVQLWMLGYVTEGENDYIMMSTDGSNEKCLDEQGLIKQQPGNEGWPMMPGNDQSDEILDRAKVQALIKRYDGHRVLTNYKANASYTFTDSYIQYTEATEVDKKEVANRLLCKERKETEDAFEEYKLKCKRKIESLIERASELEEDVRAGTEENTRLAQEQHENEQSRNIQAATLDETRSNLRYEKQEKDRLTALYDQEKRERMSLQASMTNERENREKEISELEERIRQEDRKTQEGRDKIHELQSFIDIQRNKIEKLNDTRPREKMVAFQEPTRPQQRSNNDTTFVRNSTKFHDTNATMDPDISAITSTTPRKEVIRPDIDRQQTPTVAVARAQEPARRQLKLKAPSFEGKDGENFRDFRNELTLYLRGSNLVTPLEQGEHLPTWLKGAPKAIYYSLPKFKKDDIRLALDALEEEYMGEGYKERKAQELDQARMDPKTESPNTFFNRIMQSLLVVEPDKPELHESMARTIFLNGLPHQIKMMVKDKHETGSTPGGH